MQRSMRPKEDILKDVRLDIIGEDHQDVSPLWVQSRMIEVLIDIRDLLDQYVTEYQAIVGQEPKTE